MKTINTLVFATLTALALSAPYAIAETAAKTDKKPVASDAETDKLYGAMQDRYKKMQEQMEKIRQTKDPKERQKLLQEHWQTMHEGVGMMGGGMGRGPRGGGAMMGAGPAGCQPGAAPEAMACRQNTMERRMDMMQMMMENMIEHQGQTPPATK
ncbi:MAG: hypothetical protein Q7W05_06705 [Deltaproteobacteria bacterium]|nr:hypothetical protein [Deltaproteobacteria bacterium]